MKARRAGRKPKGGKKFLLNLNRECTKYLEVQKRRCLLTYTRAVEKLILAHMRATGWKVGEEL